MSVATLHAPSRASTSSSSAYMPMMARRDTRSSHDGSRSARTSKRYSVTALYMSMNANQRDLEIEDDLARGMPPALPCPVLAPALSLPLPLPLPFSRSSGAACRTCALTHFAAQKALRELKSKISSQSKKNFVLEKDVRYLDSRIALLVQNRMALEEVCCRLLSA